MFTKEQKELLKAASRVGSNPNYQEKNPTLDYVVDQLRAENPRAFLEEHELGNRVFYNQPKDSIPYKSFVIPTIKYASL